MRQKENYLASFSVFFVSSLLILFLAKTSGIQFFLGITQRLLSPVQQVLLYPVTQVSAAGKTIAPLEEENKKLTKEAIILKKKIKELEELQKQIKNTPVVPANLVQAVIVGRRGFVPGVSTPQEIVVNKGTREGIKNGMAVISEDHVLGKIVQVAEHTSQIKLISEPQSVIAAKTLENSALGIVKGQGRATVVLQNVILSDKVAKGDTVITAGDIDASGLGFPPGLIIGKVISVAKTPSALFQAAEIETGIAITQLSSVFIVLP